MFWTHPTKAVEVFSISDDSDPSIFLWVVDFDAGEKCPIGLYPRNEADSVALAILEAF